jgi:hypothetical protein
MQFGKYNGLGKEVNLIKEKASLVLQVMEELLNGA